ncbi:hypothetical protein J1N35_034004 [Gossypium stocksii]|uniref:DUF7745 domain-containing protein n=1 Tax=Gossypium stocksii TaxID=47602 RepID=A0A9D3UT47_9ROSI|nr:hypothetical protein J1N35_034004 [Gossypium stocksii]
MVPDEILYRCGSFDWVSLLRIWGAVGYAPLLVLRQYRSKQFIPITHGLAQYEFLYKGDSYKKRVREISNAWNQTCRMKRMDGCLITTLKYNGWLNKRINDNIPKPCLESARSMEEYLQVVSSELDIIKQDFERKSLDSKRG